MPRLSTLLVTFVLGCAIFVVFAFTLVGLVGEAMVVLSVLGLIARTVSTATHRWRGHS